MATLKKHSHHHSGHHSDYDLSADLNKIKAALWDTTHDVKGKAGQILADSVEGVREQSEKLKNQMTDYTAGKPFKSLGIALLVGVAIGYLLHKS